MKEMKDPEDYSSDTEQEMARQNDIIELLLINSLRQTDLLAVIALDVDWENAAVVIAKHNQGKILGDLPFMAPPDKAESNSSKQGQSDT